ncbi:MAG: hypothetical protein O7E52_02500 [Candidatus Poribacteria bacterium]|nr:hypothetical protein [Candidatus Poribacteria bacterium]
MMSHQLIQQIEQLRDTFETKDKEPSVRVSTQSDTVQISAQLADVDRLGYLLTAVEAQRLDENRSAGIEIEVSQVEERVEMLLEKISYLTETLTLVEKTEDFSRVLIRSATPEKREDGIHYYELTLEAGRSLRMIRQCYDLKARRRKVLPFPLSKGVFERLVTDLSDILDSDKKDAVDLPHRFEEYPLDWETGY